MGLSSAGGGTADKRGYRYESRWTILNGAIPVLLGKADAVTVEPPGLQGQGVEFSVARATGDEVHQAKRERAQSSWTVQALIKERVLGPLGTHLAIPTTTAVFVSGTPAKELQSLTRRAETLDPATWRSDLPPGESRAADDIFTNWGVAEEEGHSRLRRLSVRTVDDETLVDTVPIQLGAWVEGDAEAAVELLGGFLADNLHRPLRADELWTHLRTHGYPPRDGGGSVALSERMRALADRYQEGVESTRPRRLASLPRPEVGLIVTELTAEAGRRTVAIVGFAGSGKSTIAAAVVARLRQLGVVVGPLRLDHLTPAATAAELGAQPAAGFEGPAARILSLAAAGETAALVVDQLDALSAVSGRGDLVVDGIRETLRQVRAVPNLRVLIVCRAHDLDHDRRLRDLLVAPAGLAGVEEEPLRVTVGDLADQQLTQAFAALGLAPGNVHPSLASVVRNVFNLSLLARLVEDAEDRGEGLNLSALKTRLDLLREIDAVFARRVRKLTGLTDYGRRVQELAEEMSEAGQLSLPGATTLRSDIPLRDALLTEGVLVEEAGRVRFFHQAYFDYVYALRHVSAGRTAMDLLSDDLQDLLRRGQVLAILALSREVADDSYEADLRALLFEPGVRAHLRAGVVDFLGDEGEPTGLEVDLLRELANTTDHPLRSQALSAAVRPGPAGVLARSGVLDHTARDLVAILGGNSPGAGAAWSGLSEGLQFWLLAQVARCLPAQAAKAVRPLARDPHVVCAAAGELLRLVFVAGAGASAETAGLFVDLADCIRVLVEASADVGGDAKLQSVFRQLFNDVGPMALRTLAVGSPREGAGAVVAWLKLASAVASSAGARHLFDHGGGSPLPVTDRGTGTFEQVALHAPLEIAANLAPLLLSVMEAARRPHGPAPVGAADLTLYIDGVWPDGAPSRGGQISDDLLGALAAALGSAAHDHPQDVLAVLDLLAGADLLTAQVTVAAAYAQAAPELIDRALAWARDPRTRGLQRGTTVSWSWGTVLGHVVSAGTADQRASATEVILAPYRDLDVTTAAAYRAGDEGDPIPRRRAEEQWVAASLVLRAWNEGGHEPPEELVARVDQLGRVLPPVPGHPGPVFRAGFVGSPIPPEQADAMDDDAWLAAVQTITSDDLHDGPSGLVGGAREAAHQIRRLAKDDPVRFARLLCRFGPGAHPAYAEAVLWGISETAIPFDPALVDEVVPALRAVWAQPRGRQDVLWVVQRLASSEVPDDVLEMVAWIATEAENPATETWKEASYSGEPYYGGEITSAGMNCHRGQGVDTIAALLRGAQGPSRLPILLPAIEHAAEDPVEQVRVMVPGALIELGRIDAAAARRVLGGWLARASDDGLKADGLLALAYSVGLVDPSLPLRVARRMLVSNISSVRQSGGQLSVHLIRRDQELNTPDTENAGLLAMAVADPDARAGVAFAVADLADYIPDDLSPEFTGPRPVLAWSLLVRLLDDPDSATRSAAGRFAHDLERPLESYSSLLEAVAGLVYFDDLASALFFTLRHRSGELPDAVLSLCDRWVDDNCADVGNMATRAGGTASIVVEVLLDVHAKSKPASPARRRSLDLLDRLIELGVDEAVSQLEAFEH